jgi:type I restriction enzyme M protein
MLGAVIGDIVGSRFEFNNHRSKDFALFVPGCSATDDSIMTLAVAKALMETAKQIEVGLTPEYYQLLSELTVRFMQGIGRKYPNCGYGGMFSRWMFSNNPQPYNSFGNGAAMRISPAGFAASSESEAIRLSEAITAVSHNHPEGLKGAEATMVAIYMARQGKTKDEIKGRISGEYYPLDFTIAEIRPTYKFNVTCQETVPQAIQAFLESHSFEDAIRTAISLGGDSDTIAAITGGIAEAYYGVPDDFRHKAIAYLDEELKVILAEWDLFTRSGNRKD